MQSDGHPDGGVGAASRRRRRGAVLLVHGRTWSSRPDFDLQVPGLQRSVMMSLAAHGFAAYAVDLRGYGETPRDSTGWLTPKRGAADIINVLTWVAQQHPALPKPALLAGRAAARWRRCVGDRRIPRRCRRWCCSGFCSIPTRVRGPRTSADKPQMEKNTALAAMSDFISPKVTPPAMVKAFVEQALKADPSCRI